MAKRKDKDEQVPGRHLFDPPKGLREEELDVINHHNEVVRRAWKFRTDMQSKRVCVIDRKTNSRYIFLRESPDEAWRLWELRRIYEGDLTGWWIAESNVDYSDPYPTLNELKRRMRIPTAER